MSRDVPVEGSGDFAWRVFPAQHKMFAEWRIPCVRALSRYSTQAMHSETVVQAVEGKAFCRCRRSGGGERTLCPAEGGV